MDNDVRIFDSFKEADKDDIEQYRKMTPKERVDALWHLMTLYYGIPPRLERVHSFTEQA